MGFVSRKRERHLLKKKRGGTFLLRFSESTKNGGITCTWVEYDDKGSPMFSAVEPYTREQLKVLPLPDIIRDYHVLADEVIPENPLQYLYPDTPRDEAFGPYYSERREADLPEQRKYLTRRLISVSSSTTNPSRQPEEAQALDFLVADSNASDFQDLELKAPDHHIPEASVPMVNGVVFENGIVLPNELEEPEQGGLLCNSQDPYLLQLEDEQYLGQVTSELFMPSEELQELKLDDEDLNF